MDNLSSFQLLPPHVVKLIVDHVAACSRIQFSEFVPGAEQYKKLQMPLLSVCHNFRAFVYTRFSKDYALTLRDNQDKAVTSKQAWPLRLKSNDHPTHYVARVLQFDMDVWAVYSGKALQQLLNESYEDSSFPLVRKLIINLRMGAIKGQRRVVCASDAEAKTAAFVQHVKLMAPGVREVDVNTNHEVKTYLKRRSDHALNFVKQLYDIAKITTALTDGSESLITYMDLSLVCNLTRVNMRIDKEWDMVAPLICRNAQTLTHITVITANVGAITGLVRDSGGLSTEYPCLHTLSVHLVVDPTESQRLTINEAVPFPRLRYLNLTGYYPFGDDLPFRGNAASLESLVLGLSQALVTVLEKHRVFTAVSHPKIQCVRMKYDYYQAPDELSTATSCMQFVLGIAPGAPVRVLPNMTKYEDGLASALSMLSRHTNLQVLDLYGAHILFWDAISLIGSLPLLSDLTTIPMHVNELPQGITLAELPAYMCSTYAPMSERFRCWHVGYNEICYPTTHARCMLLIALVCPNFTYATPSLPYTSGRKLFMKRMKEEIASDLFKPYAPRLRRLLFNGWSKC